MAWPLAGLAFTFWMWLGFQALPGTAALRPGGGRLDVGLIFLAGGLVEPRAYGPLLQPLANSGYPVELVELPWRCACTEGQRGELFDRIGRVMASRTGVRWVLAGHSRGAMLAARFVHERRERPAALVLMGTTHPRDFSLAGLEIPVIKINASRDGVARTRHRADLLLPRGTRWVEIEGGNHVQFGHYRWQLFDDGALISRERQQAEVRRALSDLFASIKPI